MIYIPNVWLKSYPKRLLIGNRREYIGRRNIRCNGTANDADCLCPVLVAHHVSRLAVAAKPSPPSVSGELLPSVAPLPSLCPPLVLRWIVGVTHEEHSRCKILGNTVAASQWTIRFPSLTYRPLPEPAVCVHWWPMDLIFLYWTKNIYYVYNI
jgi:hypothetical protein